MSMPIAYLMPESFPPRPGGKAITVDVDVVRSLNTMCAEDADVVEERQLFVSSGSEPDVVNDVWHHVQRRRRFAKVTDR